MALVQNLDASACSKRRDRFCNRRKNRALYEPLPIQRILGNAGWGSTPLLKSFQHRPVRDDVELRCRRSHRHANPALCFPMASRQLPPIPHTRDLQTSQRHSVFVSRAHIPRQERSSERHPIFGSSLDQMLGCNSQPLPLALDV